MVRNPALIAMFVSVLSAAQATDCVPSPTSGPQCNDGSIAQRAPAGKLMWSDTNLFQRQPDGSFRTRPRPLFRPFLDRDLATRTTK